MKFKKERDAKHSIIPVVEIPVINADSCEQKSI
jgi:hypothetical protein